MEAKNLLSPSLLGRPGTQARLLANRRSSVKVLMTGPDIDNAVK